MTEKTILVTGANGFLASHILNVLLDAGYSVLGTVRSEATADKVKETHARHADKLGFTLVPDIEAPGAFDEAVKSVDGVIHAASPYHYPVDDNERDLLRPAESGTLRILEAVHSSGNQRIKRIVITSSFGAVNDISKGQWPGKLYTEADWNPMSWDAAKEAAGGPAYTASKAFAERAAWDFIEKQKPSFTVTTICPPMIYGPLVQHVDSMEKLNTSSKVIWGLINGSQTEVPPTPFPAFANVKDVARAHKLSLERPAAANRRYLITTGSYTNEEICNIVRRNYPQLQSKLPAEKAEPPSSSYYKLDHGRATNELGMTWVSLEDTIKECVDSLLDLEKKFANKT